MLSKVRDSGDDRIYYDEETLASTYDTGNS